MKRILDVKKKYKLPGLKHKQKLLEEHIDNPFVTVGAVEALLEHVIDLNKRIKKLEKRVDVLIEKDDWI